MNNLIIKPSEVDGFTILEGRTPGTRKCAIKKCNNRGRIHMFFRQPENPNQDRVTICTKHAIGYANLILGVWKFGKDERV